MVWSMRVVRCVGEMVRERCGTTSPTKTADPVFQGILGRLLDRAVLKRRQSVPIPSKLAVVRQRTRQTTLLQRRHSPTMSRAHLPTLPCVMRHDSELPWLSNRSTDLTLLGMTAPSLSISATVSMYSFSQRSVSRTSWCRNGARFTWNWRHVRDKA